MKIKGFSLGQLGTNCYIVWESNKALIIDPGAEPSVVKDWLEEHNIQPLAILLTHAHFDHIGGVDTLRDYYHIPVYLHENEQEWLGNPRLNGSALFPVEDIVARASDEFLTAGKMKLDLFQFEIRYTPGHSPGGVSFIFPKEKLVVSGDCLFAGGIGRTDLPGGNQTQLLTSIKNELYTLGNSYKVYPGHGPTTTIENEKKNNPFVKP